MPSDKKRVVKYMQIVQAIEERIKDNILQPRDLLPSKEELMEEFQVSSITVRKAMETLVEKGIVYRVKGKGTYVSSPCDDTTDQSGYDKVYLIFDEVEELDASLRKIVQGIKEYYKNKKTLLSLVDYTFCEELVRQDQETGKTIGLIVFFNPVDAPRKFKNLRQLENNGVKLVCIDRQLGKYPANYVGSNNHDAIYSAVEYLHSLGHRQMTFVFERPDISSECERYEGYLDAMHDLGVGELITPSYKMSEIEARIYELVDSGSTAIVCANDLTASVVIRSIHAMGKNVPRDISVIGFDDTDVFRYHVPALTTLRQDYYSIGYESARILYRLMSGKIKDYTKIYIPAQLIIRDSTGRNLR